MFRAFVLSIIIFCFAFFFSTPVPHFLSLSLSLCLPLIISYLNPLPSLFSFLLRYSYLMDFLPFYFPTCLLESPIFPTFYWLQCTTPLLRTCVSVAFYRRMLNILYLARQLCALCISAFGVLR